MKLYKGFLKFTWESKCSKSAKAIKKNIHEKRQNKKYPLTDIKLSDTIVIKSIRN